MDVFEEDLLRRRWIVRFVDGRSDFFENGTGVDASPVE
jgi:hypothetical protein